MRSDRWRTQATRAAAQTVPGAAIHPSAMPTSLLPARRGLRAALLASVWVGASAMSVPANAQVSGIWTGPGTEWTTGTNWSSSPTVPDNIATFTQNGAPTSVTISSTTSIGTIQFNNTLAPAYSFAVNLALFQIGGAGAISGGHGQ
jgi:hypothetical protein